MKTSTIVTLLIGLIAGALLATALSATGSGRFGLQLCPIPSVATDSSRVARDVQGGVRIAPN